MDGRMWSFVLPYERPRLSANRRKHWSKQHREFQELRQDAFYLARHWQQRHGLRVAPGTRVDITLRWFPGDNRRTDPDNIAPSLKPLIDGIVAAGGILPDDNARYVRRTACEVVPRMHDPEQRTRPTVILEIREVVEGGGDRNGPEYADGRRRPSASACAGDDQADRAAEPVPAQRHRRGPANRAGGHGHVGNLVR